MRESTRRQLLGRGLLGAGALALAGCDPVYRALARELGSEIPDSAAVALGDRVDPDFLLLSRAGYGPRPGDLDRLRAQGRAEWIESQLHPEQIPDRAATLLARRYESQHLGASDAFEFKRDVIRAEQTRVELIRAVHSERQLLEVMTELWSDHFNVDHAKGDCAWLVPGYVRDALRPHALASFCELVRATVTHPAMLVYLDGASNQKSSQDDVPNENHARELLELHTLGVDGGYTQTDVAEVARCLTGWRVRGRSRRHPGEVSFDATRHDDQPKRVLGVEIPAGLGSGDVDRVVEVVCQHPATAHFVVGRLCRRLVAPDPPPALVQRATRVWSQSDGDLRSVLRAILGSPELAAAGPLLFKRPYRFVASALRALGATTTAGDELSQFLVRMGQLPHAYPTPDGYPEAAPPWLGNFLWRWRFAFALCAGRLEGVDLDLARLRHALGAPQEENAATLFAHLCGRTPDRQEAVALADFTRQAADRSAAEHQVLALILASPAFGVH